MARLRRPTSVLAALALAAGLLTAGASVSRADAPTVVPQESTGDDGVSVVELDLSGVDAAAMPELPSPQSVPTEEGAEPSDTTAELSLDSAEPEPTQSPEPAQSPEPTATPDPTSSPDPTSNPEPTTSPEPTSTPESTATPTEDTADPDVLTVPMDTAPFTVLGLTWDRTADLSGVQIRYRVHQDGEWSEWAGAESSDVAPDADRQDAAQADDRDGTDPIVAVNADGVQIWAQAETGTVTNLKAVLIDPGADPATVGQTATPESSAAVVQDAADTGDDAVFTNLGTSTAGTVRTAAVAQPTIVSRAGWGADESLRTCDPDMSTQMVSAAVHHTASSNNYTAAEVPGIIRGFYAYHTRAEAAGGRGWCDIGYNFLVDKFGTLYEGRAGGIDTTTVGVHTGGFNSRTIGIAAIGDYSTVAPSAALLESLSQLIAWKFTVHRILANTNVSMVSGGGASKYPAGTVVSFPTIYAHRDAQLTSCPGQTLYDRLGDIRNRVAVLANATVNASPISGLETFKATASGVQVAGWTFDPNSDASLQVQVTVNGAANRITANKSRPDVASAYGVGPNHGFSAVIATPNGRNLVCVSAINVGAGHDVVLGCAWVRTQNSNPIGALDSISTTPTSISVAGWALDPDTSESIDVHVYVDGKAVRSVTADGNRPDVDRAYGKGAAHGFSTSVPATGGTRQVCLYLINQPAGVNPLLTCRTVTVGTLPIGALDNISTTADSVTVKGWALDKDTRDSIYVHLYVDGKYQRSVLANQSRPDVDRVHGMGAEKGYTASATVAAGRHEVCVYLINAPSGGNPLLTCRTVTVTNANPIGSIDTAKATGSGIRLQGWGLDPDTTDPIKVHIYLDGVFHQITADRNRPDVDRAYGKGAAHGYDTEIAAAAGAHQVCVYLINTPTGPNPSLGCRSITVS